MSAFAPKPWRVDYEEPYEPVLLDANGQRVEGVKLWEDDADYPGGDLNVQTRANARLIVRAVNSHDELLAALEALFKDASHLPYEYSFDKDIMDRARAAMAKARGGAQ